MQTDTKTKTSIPFSVLAMLAQVFSILNGRWPTKEEMLMQAEGYDGNVPPPPNPSPVPTPAATAPTYQVAEKLPFAHPAFWQIVTDDGGKAKRRRKRTGYRYESSAYYATAKALIEEHQSGQAFPKIPLPLVEGCILVLAFFLAWQHHPLFANRKNAGGPWLTLPFEQCAKELRIGAGDFKSFLKELQVAGLVKPGMVATGIISNQEFRTLQADIEELDPDLGGGDAGIWPGRVLQQRTNIYQLKCAWKDLLPTFYPYQKDLNKNSSSPSEESGRTYSPSKSFQNGTQKHLEGLESTSSPSGTTEKHSEVHNGSSKSFPVESNQHEEESINEEEDSNFDYPNNGNGAKTGFEREYDALPEGQKGVYRFLSSIQLGSTPQGSRTIHHRAAMKLARSGASIETIETRLSQVREALESGSGITRPMGLLIDAISNDYDPRMGSVEAQPTTRRERHKAQKPTRLFKSHIPNLDTDPELVQAQASHAAPTPKDIDPASVWQEVARQMARKSDSNVAMALADAVLVKVADGQAVVKLKEVWQPRFFSPTKITELEQVLSVKIGQSVKLKFEV